MAKTLPTFKSSWKPRPPYKLRDDFARFVTSHRLALVATVEGVDMRKKRWDDVHIPSVAEALTAGSGVPPIFAMFNQLKADFCSTRWLIYTSDSQRTPDTSVYMDTLDYAVYGVSSSTLILAQRAALDILDRVAVCTNEYIGAGDKANEIYFRTFWRENSGTGTWRTPIREEIVARNPGIVALGELAADLNEAGFLSPKQDLRNISTHRFCVLHDLGKSPSRLSPAVVHYDRDDFFRGAIESLQVVRSAILYLLDAIAWREHRNQHVGLRLPLFVLPHHYIRGER